MNTYLKLSVGAVSAALAAVTLRRQNADLAMLLGILGCVLGALLVLELLQPVLDYGKRLYSRVGLEDRLLTPLLKSVGVALLSQLGAAICQDAGQSALARLLELGGAVLCLVLSLPLFQAVLTLIEQLCA